MESVAGGLSHDVISHKHAFGGSYFINYTLTEHRSFVITPKVGGPVGGSGVGKATAEMELKISGMEISGNFRKFRTLQIQFQGGEWNLWE